MEERVQEILNARFEAEAQEEAKRRWNKMEREREINSHPAVKYQEDLRSDLNAAPLTKEERERIYNQAQDNRHWVD